MVNGRMFCAHTFKARRWHQSKGFCMVHEAQFGAAMVKEQPVFGAARKHTVRLLGSFCHEVIDQDADVSFMSAKGKGRASLHFSRGVNTCHKSLTTSFFVTRSPIDLACKEEAINLFGF